MPRPPNAKPAKSSSVEKTQKSKKSKEPANVLMEKSKKHKAEEAKTKKRKAMDAEIPRADEETLAQAERRKQKKAKKKKPEPEPEPEEDEEEVEDEEDGEGDKSPEQKAAEALAKRRKNHRFFGYRAKAREAGYTRNGDVAATGVDSFASLITLPDAKRLMRFYPQILKKSSYSETEVLQRMDVSQEAVPPAAARETQARCESVLRFAMNQAVLRTVESSKQSVDAATMISVLRPYTANMMFSSVLPATGLVRFAQLNGVLSAREEDEEEAYEKEKATNVKLDKISKEKFPAKPVKSAK